ncbi:MAG: hypothetical protein AABW88_05055, partial [Nanoarchaeota archaeon]
MPAPQQDIKDLIQKYTKKVETQLNVPLSSVSEKPLTTREYQDFRKQYMPGPMSLYEKLCNASEKILKVAPGPKDKPLIERAIKVTQLNITPTGAYSFAMLAPTLMAIFGSLISFAIFDSFFFVFFFLITALVLYIPLQRMPMIMADTWRLKASNQMVLAVFFIV